MHKKAISLSCSYSKHFFAVKSQLFYFTAALARFAIAEANTKSPSSLLSA